MSLAHAVTHLKCCFAEIIERTVFKYYILSKMNTLKYNDMFLCNIVWNPGASQWYRCGVKVPTRNPWARKHPLVGHGKGYWETDEFIVTGYSLKDIPDIYRPVFQHRRQKRLEKVHATITYHAAVFIARLRQNMAKRALLGSPLPIDVISLIGSFV